MRNSSSLDWLRFMHTPNDYRVSRIYTSSREAKEKNRDSVSGKRSLCKYQTKALSDRFGTSARRLKNDFLTERIAEHFQTADNSLYHNPFPTISKSRP